jgi:hypothetical protein
MLDGFSLAAQPGCQSHSNLIANRLNGIDRFQMCGFDARRVRIWLARGHQEKFIEGKPQLVEKFSHGPKGKLHLVKTRLYELSNDRLA